MNPLVMQIPTTLILAPLGLVDRTFRLVDRMLVDQGAEEWVRIIL